MLRNILLNNNYYIDMALHVRTDYYWVSSPKEYESKAFDLACIAALAKRLNMDDLYNDAKKAFSELYNRWEREREEITKRKSSTNWLGAGSIYMSQPMMPWEFNYGFAEAAVEDFTIEQCKKELNKELLKFKSL